MNAASLLSIALRSFSESILNDIDFIPSTGQIVVSSSRTDAGILFKTQIDFQIAKVDTANDELLNDYVGVPIFVQCQDANGIIHQVGSEKYPSRLLFEENIGKSPGEFNGYKCVITCLSPTSNILG